MNRSSTKQKLTMCTNERRRNDLDTTDESHAGRLDCGVGRKALGERDDLFASESSIQEDNTDGEIRDGEMLHGEPSVFGPNSEEEHFTPTCRPRTEPPIFDYDVFIKKSVPSDKRMVLLFPKWQDIATRTALRDLITEGSLLNVFEEWTDDMVDGSEGTFYKELSQEISCDFKDVEREFDVYWAMAPQQGDLRLWEFLNLDQDLGTTGIEERLKRGHQLVFAECKEAFEKYAHLAPDDYEPCFFVEDDTVSSDLGDFGDDKRRVEGKAASWSEKAHQSLQRNMRAHISNQQHQHLTKWPRLTIGLWMGGQVQQFSRSGGAGGKYGGGIPSS